jgi:hypothetical protein
MKPVERPSHAVKVCEEDVIRVCLVRDGLDEADVRMTVSRTDCAVLRTVENEAS